MNKKRADDPFHLKVIPCSFRPGDYRRASEDLKKKGFEFTNIEEGLIVAHRGYKHHDNIPIDVIIVMKENKEDEI